ncbi:YqeB family protein [Enemella evansiae]|uniref:YqeB family protein n=1 Tax=Enemella evansiae TaxID=2016499 RepID=UPI000B978D8B|nr:hypothetical protein [Enemella evansiae]OYO04230.1 hypothetical protein CGZ97_12810 [Enemella evansiae]OYO07054.1 hypothetical protein CGZ98_21305 [Enemella evansiae]
MTTRTASARTFKLQSTGVMVLLLVCVVAGVGLGLLLPWLGGLAARFPLPYGDVLEKLSAFDQPTVVALRPAIGAVLGLLAALVLAHSVPVVTVGPDDIRIRRGGGERVLPRSEIAGIHREGGNYVIETAAGRVLYRGGIEGSRKEVRAALVERGYPWEMD